MFLFDDDVLVLYHGRFVGKVRGGDKAFFLRKAVPLRSGRYAVNQYNTKNI